MAISTVLAFCSIISPPDREVEIRQMWNKLQPNYFGSPFDKLPVAGSSFEIGALNQNFLEDGINLVKFVRFLARVPSDIELDSSLSYKAQAGAVMLSTMPKIGHQTPIPPKMNESFYSLASQGLKQGNLSRQIGSPTNLPQLIFDQIWDNAENESHVGHRRWLLNPRMKKIGLGFFESANRMQGDGVVVAHDMGRPFSTSFDYIAWPSPGAFPLEFCPNQTPWSITLDPSKYQTPTSGELKVTLKSNSQSWTFNPTKNAIASKDRPFSTINRQRFAIDNAIIFRPPLSYQYNTGEEFKVTLTGISLKDGTPTQITYNVSLFELTKDAKTLSQR